MVEANSAGLRKLAGWAGAGLLVIGIAACAGSTAMQPASAGAGSIADVRVERDGVATEIMLLGLSDPVFTAYAQQAPERVVIDLNAEHSDSLRDPLAVYDGLVEQVSLAAVETGGDDPMTRVEVSLTNMAEYEVMPHDEGLLIRIEPRLEDALSDAGEAAEFDPWADADGTMAEMEPMDTSMDTGLDSGMDSGLDSGMGWADDVDSTSWEATPATKLLGVEVSDAGDGAVVHLQADGTIESAESFTLESPDRLVVDLPGLVSEVGKDQIEVGSSQASRVRIGQHANMVRVVIDGGGAADGFQARRVVPSASGLVVALGSGASLDAAVASAAATPAPGAGAASLDAWPEPNPAAETTDPGAPSDWMADVEMDEVPAEQAPQATAVETADRTASTDDGGPVMIYGVEYDAQEGHDRVVIMGERPVDYLLFEPTPDTVILSIQHATIAPESAVRITPAAGGPLSLVTAFEQPETESSEVRVVMKRAEGLKPDVSREGSVIVIDFPHSGGIAAAPPVMETLPSGATGTAAAAPSVPVTSTLAGAHDTAPVEQTIAVGSPGSAAAAMGAAAVAAAEPGGAIGILREGGLIDGKEYNGRRISLDFKDIEMTDVLRLIAEVSDLNVIAGDEVRGKVTIRLVDVPWDQALDVILLTKGLGFMRVANVLRIAPTDVLKAEEEARLQERRALEQLEDLVVKLQPVNYANVKDVKGMVGRLLSARGTVDTDKRTNTLIIKDIPSVVDEATALVKAIDTMTPQVMIEAKVVEASLNFSREFGTRWGFGAQPLTNGFDSGSPARQDLGSDAFRLHNSEGSEFFGNNAQFINPLTAGPTALFNVAGFLLDEKLNLELQLQAAEVNGDGKVISSPRIVTLDNTKATIEQGVSIPFQTFENGDAQLEFVDAVLKLDVTPHITADRSIIMKVKVSRNAPDDSVFTLTGSPAIAKNQVDTETLVKDGQTLVIGGIYVVDKGSRQSRVPYLHKIPLIGAAFRSDEISDDRKELLIFVTPRVVVTHQQASAT